MDLPPDELAGVVDLLGPVTETELARACSELAFKRGADSDPDAVAAAVDEAIDSYHLVAVADHSADADDALLAVGPAAFPSLPEGAGDLPHIMDVPSRTLPRAAVADAAQARFRDDAALAIESGDDDRIETLLDVSYDLEAWGPVEVEGTRHRLDGA